MTRNLVEFLACAALVFSANPAHAGPPFVTDDPEPTAPGQFEIYLYSDGASGDGFAGTALGLEVDYGVLEDVQISASLPLEVNAAHGEKAHWRIGGAEIGVKYRFIEENDARPQVSFYPSLRSGRIFLPVWAQKSFAGWTLFGGGGLNLKAEKDTRDSRVSGVGVTHALGARATIGVEVFRETASVCTERDISGFDLGGIYDFGSGFAVAGAVGRQFAADATTYYLALKRTL